MSTQTSDLKHLEWVGGSIADEVGRVARSGGRIFRAIRPGKVQAVRELLASGLIDELVGLGIFPATTVTTLGDATYPLVLEHERLDFVTYPFEWSFSMFQEAALLVLRVNATANRYGYELADCHGMNVIFAPGGPMYVDLGSFIKRADPTRGWNAYDEFVRYYLHALAIWRTGNGLIARRLLVDPFPVITHHAFVLYRFSLLRALPVGVTAWCMRARARYVALGLFSNDWIMARVPGPLGRLLCYLKSSRLLPYSHLSNDQLESKVRRMRPKVASRLGPQEPGATPEVASEHILRLVAVLGPTSVLDLAGGDGERAAEIARLPGVRTVIGNGPDEQAIERCQRPQAVLSVVIDFLCPLRQCFSPPPHERLASDVVLALGLTRELLLRRRFDVEAVLAAIGAYAKQHVIVEFEPASQQEAPGWYHRDWFETHFRGAFDDVRVEVLEGDRVLCIGRKRQAG